MSINYAKVVQKDIEPSSISHPWSEAARMERLCVLALDQLWRIPITANKKSVDFVSLFQLQGSMSSNKTLREYAGRNPHQLESWLRARPHLYLTKVVVRSTTSVNVYRRTDEFRRGLRMVIGFVQAKGGAATMDEIRKFLSDRGWASIIGQLWHDCTPSLAACVRCATPFTADMGAVFEWASYENRLVATKAGVVDDVVLINWTARFLAANFINNGSCRMKFGEAVVTQISRTRGRLRPRNANADVVVEFEASACGLALDANLQDHFRIGQQNVFFEARPVFDFQFVRGRTQAGGNYVFKKSWLAVLIRKQNGGVAMSKVRPNQSSDAWMKIVEAELEFVIEESTTNGVGADGDGNVGTPSSIVSGNGYWH